MKRIIMTLMAILTICLAQAKVVNTTIQLKNVQSKQKVERVAKHLKGVTNAVYSSKYKTLYVSYDNKKTSASKIKTGLVNAGYKTVNSSNSNGKTHGKTNGKTNQYQNNHQNHQNTYQNSTKPSSQNSTKPSSHDNSSTGGSHHNEQPSSGHHDSDHRR